MDPETEPLTGIASNQPAWYTPKRLLALFCWLTFLIYLDQGVVASNGVNRPIQVGTSLSGMLLQEWSGQCPYKLLCYAVVTSSFRMTSPLGQLSFDADFSDRDNT